MGHWFDWLNCTLTKPGFCGDREKRRLYGSRGNVSSGRRSSQQLSILKLKDLNHNQSSITMELCLYTALQTRKCTNKDLTVATVMFNSDHTNLAGFSGSRKVCSCQPYNTLPTTHHYINITRASLPSPSVRPSLPPSLHTQRTPLACLVMSIPWLGRKLPRVSHSSCGVSFWNVMSTRDPFTATANKRRNF